MSADNWLECPFCKKEREKLLDSLFRKLTRKQFELLTKLVEEHNLNAKGIQYVVDNGYLENNKTLKIEGDMQLETLRVDYEYDVTEKECYFVILFSCEVCGFEESLKQRKLLEVRENDGKIFHKKAGN